MNEMLEVKKCICPKFEKTFSILGKKWTGLIIEVLMDGDKRFKELAAQIPNVSDRVLVERLKELVGLNPNLTETAFPVKLAK